MSNCLCFGFWQLFNIQRQLCKTPMFIFLMIEIPVATLLAIQNQASLTRPFLSQRLNIWHSSDCFQFKRCRSNRPDSSRLMTFYKCDTSHQSYSTQTYIAYRMWKSYVIEFWSVCRFQTIPLYLVGVLVFCRSTTWGYNMINQCYEFID